MARYPGAIWRGPVPNMVSGGNHPRLFVLHIMEGTLAGTDAWVHNPAAEVSANFGHSKSGTLYQWVDTADIAWAQGAYNNDAVSVEHEGETGDSLSPEQLENDAHLLVWAHQVHGIPFQVTDDPNGAGVIGHGLLGVAGGNHPDCPGAPILNQRQAIVDRAVEILGGDVALTQADIDSVSNETSSLVRNTGLGEIDLAGNQTGTKRTLGNVIAQRNAMDQAILSAIAKVPGSQIDYDQLGAAVAKNIDYAQLSAALAAHFKVS